MKFRAKFNPGSNHTTDRVAQIFSNSQDEIRKWAAAKLAGTKDTDKATIAVHVASWNPVEVLNRENMKAEIDKYEKTRVDA